MSYRVDYQAVKRNGVKRKHPLRLPFLTFVCFLLFLVLVVHSWPEGTALIRKVLLPDDNILTVSALNDFANDLHIGEGVFDAFLDFCRNFIP